ncbi:MAG: tRNA (adenosine(37)-N6)-threonylcarbamoyltransferase complex ATPase subunit type 1 TsaE [Candidatus Omnitrophica bacterium]|nr:tRNA (adenosine(37)-N6)-threonylcarbamoyltransferase complex ATPase subunit type 1 TsaE [Candidatus Omnitrophota bacterium]
MTKSQKIVSSSVEETVSIAKKFAAGLKAGNVLALEGDLGSGKTTFVKGIASGLGLNDSDAVKSPTFVLMHIYPTRIPLYHFDLYRLEGNADLAAVGLEDFIYDPKAITCVEWAEKAGNFFPSSTYRIALKILGSDKRQIEIKKASLE